MLSNLSIDNPFEEWENLNNDSLLDGAWATPFYQGLAFVAAVIHLSPWIKHAFPMCVQMWKDPVERFLFLSRRYQENSADPMSTSCIWLASECIFVMLFPCMLLFPVLIYVGLPAGVIYGAPWSLLTDESPLLPLTGWLIVAWIVVWHGLDCMANYWTPKFENDKPHNAWQLWGRLGLLMAFFGALCMTSFAAEMARIGEQIQYVGPVRLSHIAMYYRDESSENKATADGEMEYPYVYASWTAEFGSSWACPNMPSDHWCQVRQTACHHTACYKAECTESEIDLSKAMTRECLNMISLHWMDGAYDSTKTFDRAVSPRQDGKHWPAMNAYANCQTCEIYGATRTGYGQAQELLRGLPHVEQLRGYGIPLLLIGWLLSAAVFAWTVFSPRAQTHSSAVSTSDTHDFEMVDGDLELEAVLPASVA